MSNKKIFSRPPNTSSQLSQISSRSSSGVLYGKIPPLVPLDNIVDNYCVNNDNPQMDLKEVFPVELPDKYMIHLLKIKRKKNKRTKKSALSLKEKRQLGLYKLRKNDMKYKDFLPLHNLWKEYFLDSINLNLLKCHSLERTNHEVQRRLLKMDYHGAILTVKRSTCCSLVGKKGILVYDTKNTFQLLTEDNNLRIIPKKNTEFIFTVENFTFTVLGNHFLLKSAARMTKKLKTNVSVL